MGNQEIIRIDDPWSEGYAAGYKDAKEDYAKAVAKAEKETAVALTALTMITRYTNDLGHEVLKVLRGR